jgi:hypothetical protein
VEIGAFSVSLLYFVKDSLLTAMPYDTRFYQLQAVRWLEVSRLFPGLSAVHTRLGFDSLSLVASALLHISNNWMLLGCVILAAAEAELMIYALSAPREKRLMSICYAVVCAVLLPFGYTFFDLGALSTDVVPCALILFSVFWPIRLFEGATAPAYLALLPVMAVAAKLNAAVIAIGSRPPSRFRRLRVVLLQVKFASKKGCSVCNRSCGVLDRTECNSVRIFDLSHLYHRFAHILGTIAGTVPHGTVLDHLFGENSNA